MKVAIFSESEADDAALKILTEAIIGKPVEPVLHAGLRFRGWPSVRDVLKPVLLELHYDTDALGFVMVVDSDATPPHNVSHEQNPVSNCRLCQLRRIRDKVLSDARPRRDRPALKTAIGLAVPAIEAWLRSVADTRVNEARWFNGLVENQPPYSTRGLKIDLYGTDRPPLAMETERMREAASQLAQNLAAFERNFPNGFGAFALELRNW